ncbi:VWA domain-containing protein [uncultured Marinobacter sp.]|uniref:nitric oxide reductase activation protein NorD n=1 Tax=uncultured Marinobacter sp. TaxID=187379 RepID=UPI0030DBE9A9
MAEAEEVVSDVARHATVYAQSLWKRYRTSSDNSGLTTLNDVAARLDLLITAIFGEGYPLRVAQPPAHATMLAILFRHDRRPRREAAVPATDGVSVWLPPDLGNSDGAEATVLYRVMALQQVVRARRGGAKQINEGLAPVLADIFLLLEAYSADLELAGLLPGMTTALAQLRQRALTARPPLQRFPGCRQPLEQLYRSFLVLRGGQPHPAVPFSDSPAESLATARRLLREASLVPEGLDEKKLGPEPLLKDWWTGEFRSPPEAVAAQTESGQSDGTDEAPRGGHLPRRPRERKPTEEEERNENEDSIWMIQGDESHPHAEDPMGMQRPVDRDDDISADQYGDLVSEMTEARLVSTPGQPKEVLLSDDPPDARAKLELKAAIAAGEGLSYPEWDYRNRVYRVPGATVRLLSSGQGSQQWVDDTLRAHEVMLNVIRRHFEMLSARRVRYRKQTDGDDIDLDACIESYADYQAGRPLSDGLYLKQRSGDRNMAILLLMDISGSTDSWVSANKRIIDVEREALLLVCVALERLGEPYAVQAFSGEGPDAVTVRQVKRFDESYDNEVALRISALEPQHYTRAGAALRHATAGLMKQPAAHRLLLLLSDGKPNDKDDYEGRYGVEDMRQAVTEASLQGISPFCLTIDRQSPNYLPRIFGAHQYRLLTRPELLATVLLDWMKQLIARN